MASKKPDGVGSAPEWTRHDLEWTGRFPWRKTFQWSHLPQAASLKNPGPNALRSASRLTVVSINPDMISDEECPIGPIRC